MNSDTKLTAALDAMKWSADHTKDPKTAAELRGVVVTLAASLSASSDTGGAPDPEWWDEKKQVAKGAAVAAEEARDEALIARVLERFRPSEAWWDMGEGERQSINWHEVVGIVLAYGGALPVKPTSTQLSVSPDPEEDCERCEGDGRLAPEDSVDGPVEVVCPDCGGTGKKAARDTGEEPGREGEDQCAQADQPHTVWWWNSAEADAGGPPVPLSAGFDNQADALDAAEKLVGKPGISWVKVFRSDNENYTCWRWNAEPANPSDSSGGGADA